MMVVIESKVKMLQSLVLSKVSDSDTIFSTEEVRSLIL